MISMQTVLFRVHRRLRSSDALGFETRVEMDVAG